MRAFLLLTSCALVACGGLAAGPDDASDDQGPFGRNPDGSDGNSYIDPHCPEASTPPNDITCNVFENGCIGTECCPAGSACYPVVIPPSGPCTTESYGAYCIQSGTGTQGASCGGSAECAGGFVCLITGANTQCAKMCDLEGSHNCPDGFVCEPIDIPGFSACL